MHKQLKHKCYSRTNTFCSCSSHDTQLLYLRLSYHQPRKHISSLFEYNSETWYGQRFKYLYTQGSTDMGRGVLNQFPPIRYFPDFFQHCLYTLVIEYHVYVWKVSPQLNCRDPCQIWTWLKESNRYFCKIENYACTEKLTVRAIVTPPIVSTINIHGGTRI